MIKVRIKTPKSIGQPTDAEGKPINGKSRPMTEQERATWIKKLQPSKYHYK